MSLWFFVTFIWNIAKIKTWQRFHIKERIFSCLWIPSKFVFFTKFPIFLIIVKILATTFQTTFFISVEIYLLHDFSRRSNSKTSFLFNVTLLTASESNFIHIISLLSTYSYTQHSLSLHKLNTCVKTPVENHLCSSRERENCMEKCLPHKYSKNRSKWVSFIVFSLHSPCGFQQDNI